MHRATNGGDWRRRMGLAFGVLLALATTVGAEETRPAGAAGKPFTGEIDLLLRRAVFHNPDDAGKGGNHLLLHLEARDGQWQRIWGKAQNYGIGEHMGIVESAEITDTSVRIQATVLIKGDFYMKVNWVATYQVEAQRQPDGSLTGTFKGTLRGREFTGGVEGRVPPPRATRPGIAPPAPDEHPRVLFRKSDLPRLREKLKTPLGQAYLARARESGDLISLGVLHQLTGDKAYAEQARAAIQAKYKGPIPVQSNGSGDFGHDIFMAAVTYDLCHDAWPEDFRGKLRTQFENFTERQQYILMTSHANFHPCSNYYGPGRGVPGVTAMILWGDRGDAPPKPRDPVAKPWPVSPPKDYKPGKGVPTVALEMDKSPARWIWSGPLPAECSRDVLTGLGGYAAARPEVGTTASFTVRTEKWFKQASFEFKELAAEATGPEGIDLDKAVGKTDPTVLVLFTAVEVKTEQVVGLVREGQEMKAWISGVEMDDRVFYKLLPGVHPLLVELRLKETEGTVAPRVVNVDTQDPSGGVALAKFEQRLWQQDQALWEKTGMAPIRQLWLDRGWFQNYQHYRWGMGDGGTQTETGVYAQISSWYPSVYASMYANFFGRSPTAYPDVTHLIPRKMMQSVFPAAVAAAPPARDRKGRLGGQPLAMRLNSVMTLNPQWMSTHFPIIPPEYQPAALWVWNYLTGVSDEASLPNVVGDSLGTFLSGLTRAQSFINYPLDMKPVHPQEGMPRHWSAGTFGLHIFRSGWEGGDEFVAQVWGKSAQIKGWSHPNAGGFQVYGLGRPWTWVGTSPGTIRDTYSIVLLPEDEIFEGASGRLLYEKAGPDGSGSLTFDLSDVYAKRSRELYDSMTNRNPEGLQPSGISGLRAVAFDYSGKSGAPALMVLVDKIEGGGKRLWTWQKPIEAGHAVSGNTFTIKYPDATMQATFVTPGDAKVEYAEDAMQEGVRAKKGFWGTLHRFKVEAGGSFFVVATFQRGEPPKVTVEGTGLDATVTVGGQKVRFDGKKIVFGT